MPSFFTMKLRVHTLQDTPEAMEETRLTIGDMEDEAEEDEEGA